MSLREETWFKSSRNERFVCYSISLLETDVKNPDFEILANFLGAEGGENLLLILFGLCGRISYKFYFKVP